MNKLDAGNAIEIREQKINDITKNCIKLNNSSSFRKIESRMMIVINCQIPLLYTILNNLRITGWPLTQRYKEIQSKPKYLSKLINSLSTSLPPKATHMYEKIARTIVRRAAIESQTNALAISL